MAKEWILNVATNRWGLNKKRCVGPTSKWIRECSSITYEQTPELHKWKNWMEKTHKKFFKEKGGKVFVIFSIKKNGRKEIFNAEVVEEIKKEIERLRKERLNA